MKRYQQITAVLLGIILGILLFFTSCGQDTPEPDNTPDLRPLSAAETKVIHSANNFSMEIFSRINTDHPDENIFISPFSISTALSMTLNGARGETLSAMKETLQLDMTEEEINEAYKELVDFLLSMDKTVTIEIANSNWYKEDLTINPDFEAALLEYYDAEVQAADFHDAATLDQINGWIENKTHGKIKNMLDVIPQNAIMYLINAIYFKADWQYRFDAAETADRDFFLADGSATKVPTMYSKGVKLNYASNEQLELIDIPYGNGQYSFTVILLREDDVNAVIENLNVEQLYGLLSDTSSISVELYLPKLKIEFKKGLKDVLIAMGMGNAFEDADFGNLFSSDVSAAISRVMHQSFLEVNEEGSEAAAATIVEIVKTSAGPPASIHINRPFLFFIREKHSNTILFSGKVMDPGL